VTTLPVTTIEAALEKVGLVRATLQIEVLHKVLKSGCQIEQRQLHPPRAWSGRCPWTWWWRGGCWPCAKRPGTTRRGSERLVGAGRMGSPVVSGASTDRATQNNRRTCAKPSVDRGVGRVMGRQADGDPGQSLCGAAPAT